MSPDRRPPRWVRWTVVPLLVLVPVGYAAVSAEQSRDSGKDKESTAAATGLTPGWPTKVQRRVYEVPIPVGARQVARYETNSWEASVLYVRFTTTPGGLDTFLARAGTSRSALRDGEVTLTAEQARTADWHFSAARDWSGLALPQPGARPDRNITVNLTDPDTPAVYVASTVDF